MEGPVTFLNIEWFFRLFYGIFSIVFLIFSAIAAFLASLFDGKPGVGFGEGGGEVAKSLGDFWNTLTAISTLISLTLATIAVYSYIRLRQVREVEKERLKAGILVAQKVPEAVRENPRWKHIEELMKSDRESDWRQAIIEADIMLDEMLSVQGYQGESVGDKLKRIEPSDMTTLDDAWSAHKVRNEIAHTGSGFLLTERDARVTISQFERVFREFSLI
jgi:hypothetical protein